MVSYAIWPLKRTFSLSKVHEQGFLRFAGPSWEHPEGQLLMEWDICPCSEGGKRDY